VVTRRLLGLFVVLLATVVLANCGGGGSASNNGGGSSGGSAPPIPDNRTAFVRTDDTPSALVYDSAHNVVYAALPDLEQVDIINPATLQIVKTIPVPDAQVMSLSPDCTRVLVGGDAQEAVWIDTSLQRIAQRSILPTLQPSCSCPPNFVSLGNSGAMIMANGRVIFSDLLEWNPASSQYTQVSGTPFLGGFGWAVRSADGTKAIFSNGNSPGIVGIYDSAADSITATKTVDDPFALAANPTGTQFVVAGDAQGTIFVDNQLNTLATVPVDPNLSGMVYSPDGKYLYTVSTPANVPIISKIDATSFQLISQAPAYMSTEAYISNTIPIVEQPEAADSTGLVFGIADHGVAIDDATDAQTISSSTLAPVFAIIVTPAEGPVNSSTPVLITTQSFNATPTAWFGTVAGVNPSLTYTNSGQLKVTAPPSSAAGPVNVKILSPDGTEANIPQAFTYGAASAASVPLAVPPGGGVGAEFFGYGYGSDLATPATQVQIANRIASVVGNKLVPTEGPYPFPLDDVVALAPAGSPGAADVRITSQAGSATLSSAVHYEQSAIDYPSPDTFQFVLYDPTRDQVYLSAGNHIDVFSMASHSFLAPITPPTLNGQSDIVWLALTPDDSTLLAANLADDSVAVIDPDNPLSATAAQIVPAGVSAGFGPSSIAPTSNGFAFVATESINPDLGGADNVYQLDTSSLQVTPVSASTVPGPDSFLGGPALLAASANGSTVIAYFAGESAGESYTWNASTGEWLPVHYTGYFINDGAVSGDGEISAIGQGSPAFPGTTVSFFDSNSNLLARSGVLDYLNFTPIPRGLALNDSGALAYLPVGAGNSYYVDIYDSARNSLRERIVLSESFPAFTPKELAIDPTGHEIFLITNKGLTVITLDAVPMSIAYLTPSFGGAGATVTIRGSGFVKGVTAQFNGTAGSVTFVDANTLQATLPASLTSGPVSVTLAQPGGSTYTFDDCFTVQ